MNTFFNPLALLFVFLLAFSPAGRSGVWPDARPGEAPAKVISSLGADDSGPSAPAQAAAERSQQGAHFSDAAVLGKTAPPLVPAIPTLRVFGAGGSWATRAGELTPELVASGTRLHVLKCVWRC